MTTRTIDIHLPKPHTAQRRVLREAQRFNVLAMGRRWGKSSLGIDCLLRPALEGFPVAWASPTYSMLLEVWREVKRLLLPVATSTNASQHRITLATRGVIEMWSLDNADTIRGRKYKRFIIDEAAMVPALGDAWNAVIRPTLADMLGDGWLLSTPRGRNFFWDCWLKGQDPNQGDWASWQMPTDTNPFIPEAEVAALRAGLPERTRLQEIEAQFLEDGSLFRRVQEAATATPQDAAVPGHSYVAGIDWARAAGGDFTVFAVIDSAAKELVYLDRFSGIDYSVQMSRLRAMYERFRPVIYSELNNMGGPVTELLQREGFPITGLTTTNATKAARIDALALAFERGDIRILNDPVLIGELHAYEGTQLPSGLIRYSAPEGQHDDCVSALMMAWQGCMQPDWWVFGL